MRTRTIQILGFLAAVSVAWAVVTLLDRSSSNAEDGWEAAEAEEVQELETLKKWRGATPRAAFRRLPTDPASSFLTEWRLGRDSDAKALVDAAEAAVELPERLTDAEPGWASFYNGLTDPFFMHDVVEVCGARVEPSESCYIGVRVVASPEEGEDEPGSAVEYAGVAGTEPDSTECRAYASCVAHAMLGRALPPLPDGYDEPQGTEVTWHVDAWDDDRIQKNRGRIVDCINHCKDALAMLSEATLDSQEDADYQVGNYQSRLEWCEMLLVELDGA